MAEEIKDKSIKTTAFLKDLKRQVFDVIGFYMRDVKGDEWEAAIDEEFLKALPKTGINEDVPGRTSLVRAVAGLTLLFYQKRCRFTKGKHSWTMEVDGQVIRFHGDKTAVYFRRHYSDLDYTVIVNETVSDDEPIYSEVLPGADKTTLKTFEGYE